MIESILNRKKSIRKTPIASLSIEILPEYGWSIGPNNERAFGPGTLFKGFVIVTCKELSERAEKLSLLFQGMESMLTYEIGIGAIRSNTVQFFKINSTLWEKTDESEALRPFQTYKFMFTIQMPMVQFPPSMSHDFYKCSFKLSAHLYPSSSDYSTTSSTRLPVTAQTFIKYIPLIETRVSKIPPIYLEDLRKKKKKKKVKKDVVITSVELSSIEYVIGDTIQATVHIERNLHDDRPPSSDTYTAPLLIPATQQHVLISITMDLYQISRTTIDDEPIIERLVETQTHIIKENSTNKIGHYPVTLKLDKLLPPSFEYGRIISVSYKLKIMVQVKKISPPPPSDKVAFTGNPEISSNSHDATIPFDKDCLNDSSLGKRKGLKKYLGLPWSSVASVFETPIVIGTLGRGIRTYDELRNYSNLNSRSNNLLTYLPSFIQVVENEDILPEYEPTRLPSYNDTSNKQYN
ncbi:hypothetical protein BD770DRAFT_475700 [Pilaira anomala]|nr:hypothetical protein BD770DRAFT_475700 [Pilaira anomala]